MVATKKLFSFENRSPERPFNRLIQEDYWVSKRVMDKFKGERELHFYKMLDNEMKSVREYFPRLLSYIESLDWLEYKIEFIPHRDLASEYLENHLTPDRFQNLLQDIYQFLVRCPSMQLKPTVARELYKKVFVDRLDERWSQFQQMSCFQQVLAQSPTNITEHYVTLRRELVQLTENTRSICAIASHGDLCFSNMIYWKSDEDKSDRLRMVDPRGGNRWTELLLPWSYDLAKISQCVFGNYDGILRNKSIDFSVQKNQFSDWVKDQGYSMKELRLIEASHFMSLLPFHADQADLQGRFIQASQSALQAAQSESL